MTRGRGSRPRRTSGWPVCFKSFDDRHLRPPAPLTDEQRALLELTPEQCEELDRKEAQQANDQEDTHG